MFDQIHPNAGIPPTRRAFNSGPAAGPGRWLTAIVNNLLDEDDPINELSTGIIIPREPRTWSIRFLKEF